MLLDEFFVIFAESFVVNFNKSLQFFNGVLFFSGTWKALENLFKSFFGVIKKLQSFNEFEMNIKLLV